MADLAGIASARKVDKQGNQSAGNPEIKASDPGVAKGVSPDYESIVNLKGNVGGDNR